MQSEPSSSLFTHYVLENPWPLGGVLLAIALILGWLGAREGLGNRVRIALLIGIIGAAVMVSGTLITTAGEHGEAVTRSLVHAAVGEDLVGGLALFSDDATLHVGSSQSPGYGHAEIQARFAELAQRYDIETNRISELNGQTISADESQVRLGCSTTVTSFPYPNSSHWLVRVKRMPDGSWKITKLTCLDINGQPRLW
jgi:hypothetical protein